MKNEEITRINSSESYESLRDYLLLHSKKKLNVPFKVFKAIKQNYVRTTTTAVSPWWEALENNDHLEQLQCNDAFYCRFYSVANKATNNNWIVCYFTKQLFVNHFVIFHWPIESLDPHFPLQTVKSFIFPLILQVCLFT